VQQTNCPPSSLKYRYVKSTLTYPMCYQSQKLLIGKKQQVCIKTLSIA